MMFIEGDLQLLSVFSMKLRFFKIWYLAYFTHFNCMFCGRTLMLSSNRGVRDLTSIYEMMHARLRRRRNYFDGMK